MNSFFPGLWWMNNRKRRRKTRNRKLGPRAKRMQPTTIAQLFRLKCTWFVKIYSQNGERSRGERKKSSNLMIFKVINEKLLTWSGLPASSLTFRKRNANGDLQHSQSAKRITSHACNASKFWAVPWEYIRLQPTNKRSLVIVSFCFPQQRFLLSLVEGLNCSLARSISMLSKLSKSCYFAIFQEKLGSTIARRDRRRRTARHRQ